MAGHWDRSLQSKSASVQHVRLRYVRHFSGGEVWVWFCGTWSKGFSVRPWASGCWECLTSVLHGGGRRRLQADLLGWPHGAKEVWKCHPHVTRGRRQ